jgi:hypothetical protein
MAENKDSKTTQPPAPKSSVRIMSKDINVYYSNCAMVAMSPMDISLFYGRFVPTSDDKGARGLTELYERQIYMTFEQAEQIVKLLSQTLDALKANKMASAKQNPKNASKTD